MSSRQVQRWTGGAGIAAVVIQLAAFVVFFSVGKPPNRAAPLMAFLQGGNAALQTSFLLFFVAFGAWLVFFGGLRSLVVAAGPGLDFLATTVFGFGVAIMVLSWVYLGLEAAATANALTRPDNTVIYALFMGGSVLDGAPTAAPAAFLLGISGWALARSRLLSRWAVWLSWIAALIVVASLPTLYGGDNLAGDFSADGLVAYVLLFVPLYVWTVALSIAIFRKPASQ